MGQHIDCPETTQKHVSWDEKPTHSFGVFGRCSSKLDYIQGMSFITDTVSSSLTAIVLSAIF